MLHRRYLCIALLGLFPFATVFAAPMSPPPAPLMTSVTPNAALTSVTINGANLSGAGISTAVTIDSVVTPLTLTTITSTSVTASLPSSPALVPGSYLVTLSVSNSKGTVADEFWMTLGAVGPQGPAGTNGTNGTAATVTVGSTATGAPGTSASVSNSGTTSAAVLNFTIPQGATGAPGANGDKGDKGDIGPAGPAGSGLDANGNLTLADSTGSGGNILKNGSIFLHNFGQDNTFLGGGAGNFSSTAGFANVGIGTRALQSNPGASNVAIGFEAMGSMQGFNNIGIGRQTLNHIAGDNNTAVGYAAGYETSSGSANTLLGLEAAYFNNGSRNVAIGFQAAFNVLAGDDNIHIGSRGLSDDTHVIRIGTPGTQTQTFIAGIYDPNGAGVGMPVVIDSAGKLSTANVVGTQGPPGPPGPAGQALTWIDANSVVVGMHAGFDISNNTAVVLVTVGGVRVAVAVRELSDGGLGPGEGWLSTDLTAFGVFYSGPDCTGTSYVEARFLPGSTRFTSGLPSLNEGWSHILAVGQNVLPSNISYSSIRRAVEECDNGPGQRMLVPVEATYDLFAQFQMPVHLQ